MAFVNVARVEDVAAGAIVPVEAEGVKMILYRVGDDYRAVQRYCVHQRADLARMGVLEDGFLVCMMHDWRYHAATGVHELSPETCLTCYPVRVEGEHIQVDPTPRHPA